MTDTFEQPGEDQNPEPIKDALLRDLRSLPMVTAPLDFQVHLKQRIAEIEATATLPWWQRFFKPAREGGFPIPAFAYGAVATVVVLTVSIYVYRATNVEQTLQEKPLQQIEQTVPTAPESEPLPKEVQPTPKVEITVPSAEPTRIPAPQVVEKKSNVPAKQLRAAPVTPPSEASPPAKEENDKTEAFELIFKTRGGVDAYNAITDTTLSDSLRRLDSLRRYQLQHIPPKEPDPR